MAERSRITIVDNTSPYQPSGDDWRDLAPSTKHRKSLVKKFTKNSVRKGRAKRKYAKWQPDRYGDMTGSATRENTLSTQPSFEQGAASSQSVSQRQSLDRPDTLQTSEESECPDPLAWEGARRSEVDILYENQRGWFFFGIPMFSGKSLLNFDPPAWMTRNNDVSPVNITNAQLPDPSWEWAWKTWYVDMSYDVDEEGWQYSFSFASSFSWHGAHPWFHSFVRRRRWLRMRVKKQLSRQGEGEGGETRGLAPSWSGADYFNVCTQSARSSCTSIDVSGGRSTYGTGAGMAHEDYQRSVPPDEITNIVALCKAIKSSTLDREKLDAVDEFIHRGGDELAYLADRVSNHIYRIQTTILIRI